MSRVSRGMGQSMRMVSDMIHIAALQQMICTHPPQSTLDRFNYLLMVLTCCILRKERNLKVALSLRSQTIKKKAKMLLFR